MPRESLSVKYYRHDETVLIRPIGPIVESTSSHLIRPILTLLKKGVTSLVLDLTQVSAIDMSGIETLEEANDLITTIGQPTLRLVVKPNSRVDNAIKTAGVQETYRIYDSAEQAWSDTNSRTAPPADSVIFEEAGEDMYLKVAREIHDSIVVYAIEGELDLEEVRQFKKTLIRDLELGNTKVVIDMHLVRFVDSSALGLFASVGNRLRKGGGDLRFARLSEQARRVFSVFRLDNIYRCFGTVNGAIESFEIV
ncbi:MAG: STAS domain-containing protein [bacterium]